MAAAASPAVDRAAAAKVVDRAAVAVRVVADHPVDSVVAVEAVETADASLSYLKREVSGPTAHLFYCVCFCLFVAKALLALHHHVSTTERQRGEVVPTRLQITPLWSRI